MSFLFSCIQVGSLSENVRIIIYWQKKNQMLHLKGGLNRTTAIIQQIRWRNQRRNSPILSQFILLIPLKTLENQEFSDVFRGGMKKEHCD